MSPRHSRYRGQERESQPAGVAASLPLADGISQMGHPGRGGGADLLQGQAVGVHTVEQADADAEQHGRERDRELVDQAGVQVLLDRLGAAADADVAVAGGLAACASALSMPSLTK